MPAVLPTYYLLSYEACASIDTDQRQCFGVVVIRHVGGSDLQGTARVQRRPARGGRPLRGRVPRCLDLHRVARLLEVGLEA